jgi:RimJ/RimL family protein N-acetyltransferase
MFNISKAQVADPYFIINPLECCKKMEREEVSQLILKDRAAYTLWYKDKPVAIIGATMIHAHCAYGWSYLSEDIKLCKKSFVKTLRDFVEDFFKHMSLVRFFVAVDVDNEAAIRQNEWMGLSREAVLRKSGVDGKDQLILAKVRE